MATKAGVTYICLDYSAIEEFKCTVLHYNDGDLDQHIMADNQTTCNFRGQVYEPSNPVPNYEQPLFIRKGSDNRDVEGIFCEALLRPGTERTSTQPYAMFVRFMINIEAKGLDYMDDAGKPVRRGTGFPVGWAVRGFLPGELRRRALEQGSDGGNLPEKNEMNMLPVFRADFEYLSMGSPKNTTGSLQRMYYITNQEKYQKLRPKSLLAQVADAVRADTESGDNVEDIMKAKQKVLTRDR